MYNALEDASEAQLLRNCLFSLLVGLCCVLGSGCAYKIGSGLTAGVLDEVGGSGRSEGVEDMGDRMLERALLVELGHQLGSGLRDGATAITPEQQHDLEAAIDGLLMVAAKRTGKGLRNEVSPELRAMVQNGIVDALSDGLRGDLGDSLESTVDRVVDRAVLSLREGMQDERMRYAMADLLRESVYYAMREGQGGTPAVAETLEFTLTENMLHPVEQSVGGITDRVALQVEEQYQRTEKLLYGIIGVLLITLVVAGLAYVLRGIRLQRAEASRQEAAAVFGSIDHALEGLDEDTRRQVLEKLEKEAQRKRTGLTPEPAERRGDDYMR